MALMMVVVIMLVLVVLVDGMLPALCGICCRVDDCERVNRCEVGQRVGL